MYKIINVPLQKLRDYEDNPRNNALAVDKVKASIERVGFMFPIVIDLNYVIVCGHTRKLACAVLGHKTVPCIMVDDLTPEQVDLFRYVDNKTSEYASWDYERLAEELRLIDISVGPNDFIVKAFDFDLESREFENVPVNIPVATFNFMGDGYKKGTKRQKAAVDVPYESASDEDEAGLNTGTEGGTPERSEGGSEGATVFGESKKADAPVLHTFRCGNSRFIISEREEERLVGAYQKYMSEVYPESSFLQYLLGGVEIAPIQSESAN